MMDAVNCGKKQAEVQAKPAVNLFKDKILIDVYSKPRADSLKDQKLIGNKSHRKVNMWLVTGAVSIIFLLSFFVIRPSLVGYGIYQQVGEANMSLGEYTKSYQDLELELFATSANLTLYKDFGEGMRLELSDLHSQITVCESDRKSLEKEVEYQAESCALKDELIDSLDERVSAAVEEKTLELTNANELCLDNLDNQEEELSGIREDYKDLITNTARSICCKERVDSLSIDSYRIVDDRIVCTSGSNMTIVC